MTAREANCTTCRFYAGHSFDGVCKRHAPVYIERQVGTTVTRAFPNVGGQFEWCGDHEPAEQPSEGKDKG